jgi:HTH-type transcriptional regulator, competence development regulator
MKYSIPKERILSASHDDEGYEIAAGFSALTPDFSANVPCDCSDANVEESVDRCAFSSLIQLLRRAKKLTVGRLAELARVEASELLMIENDMRYLPRPRTVHQLAQFFGLPENRLIELSSLKTVKNHNLQDAAVRFAANAKNISELSREEQSALNEFVKFLSS